MAVTITADEAQAIATRVMYELLGRRWVWPAVTTTERVEIPAGQDWISLEGRPVISIASVTLRRANSTSSLVDYVLENKHRLRLATPTPYSLTSQVCTGPRPSYDITYTYGSPPPLEVEVAIEKLAEEIALSYNNPDDCALPDTVTSATRQGISMQFASAQDFLDRGRTGLTVVDNVLARFNSAGTRRRATVYSVNKPPPRRRDTVQESGS